MNYEIREAATSPGYSFLDGALNVYVDINPLEEFHVKIRGKPDSGKMYRSDYARVS